ncbi:apoptosis-associated speck-like protein containing a CARD [Notamacropus eugenii]|uniref:apoptosis-associated speck-like protein containing a CARD n=1 Tax=Notamacropus eugenii TaxID=9315 RepID=UPI003B66E2D3
MPCGRDLILKALENLNEEEFKKFKIRLRDVPLRPGYSQIPRGPLLEMDRLDISDKIVCCYLEDYGMELTVQVLQNIGMREEAVRLQQAAPASRPHPTGNSAQPTHHSATASAPSETHFVDKHRASFISDVTLVDPILDRLYDKVLSTEQYESIRAESTPQKQMRMLYFFTRSWDDTCKDLLLKALKETHPFLVQRLERS